MSGWKRRGQEALSHDGRKRWRSHPRATGGGCCAEDLRKALEVVREVACRREERRLAVLVAAVARHGREALDRRADLRAVRLVQAEAEDREVLLNVRGLAEPSADDDRGDGGLLHDVAHRDVGDRGAVLGADGVQR